MSRRRLEDDHFVKLPYLFVVGCPRSGTTLLQRMLDSHPRLAVANDTHFIPRVIRDVAPGTDPPLSAQLVERVRSYHRFARLGLNDSAVEASASTSTSYSEFVGSLYGYYARRFHKPLAGEKTPDYVRCLGRLHDLFPWARIAHIIRDGRNVALSTLSWARPDKGPGRFGLWAEQPVAVCALWWQWQVSEGRKDGAVLGTDHYREVCYEDLVERPDSELRELSRFLDLSYTTHMLNYHKGRTRSGANLSAKKAWLPPTPGLRDWTTQMEDSDVELFEALAGDLLEELGYPRVHARISAPVSRQAKRCRRWWDREMDRKRAKRQQRRLVTHMQGADACSRNGGSQLKAT